MVLGRYNNYDPVTKKVTGIALVPYVTAIDTASLPANYTDISTIENWDEFGGETTLNTNQVRTEIKTLVVAKTFTALTAPEKIVASKWFVVDKVDRDTIHDPATQIKNAADLSTKINDIGIDTKLLVSGTVLKDSDVVDIEKELSKTLASADWNIYHKRDSHPTSPVSGQVYYNTNDIIVYFWNGSSWENTGLSATEIKTLYESNADTNEFSNAEQTKLAAIETSADVTDPTNVNAAGAVMENDSSTTSMSFVLDEDNMASNSAIKLSTQQSIKAYVDAQIGGLTPEWLDIWRKSATNDQTGIDEGTDILFDGSRGEGITYNDATGVVTLKANRVYRLWATFAVFSIEASETVAIQWVKANDNLPLEEGHETRLRPQSSSSNGNNQPTIEVIYKPTSDTDVKLRVTEYTGTPDTISMYWDRAMGTVMRIR